MSTEPATHGETQSLPAHEQAGEVQPDARRLLALEDDRLLRCRSDVDDGLQWFYGVDGERALLYHEWYGFEARDRPVNHAAVVIGRPDVDVREVDRRYLEKRRRDANAGGDA